MKASFVFTYNTIDSKRLAGDSIGEGSNIPSCARDAYERMIRAYEVLYPSMLNRPYVPRFSDLDIFVVRTIDIIKCLKCGQINSTYLHDVHSCNGKKCNGHGIVIEKGQEIQRSLRD